MKLDEYLVHGDLHIPRGGLLRIKNGRGLSVHVWEGTLWVTQECSRRDIVLEAGQSFRLDRQGCCVIEATTPSAVALSSPHEHACAEAIDLIPAGSARTSPSRRPRHAMSAAMAMLRVTAAAVWPLAPAPKRGAADASAPS